MVADRHHLRGLIIDILPALKKRAEILPARRPAPLKVQGARMLLAAFH